MKWIYYLHIDGNIIGKNPEYWSNEDADSPFVRAVWTCDSEDRGSLIRMLSAAKTLGARPERIKELETKANVTDRDYAILNLVERGMSVEEAVSRTAPRLNVEAWE